jgi:hypothetical protein
VKTIKFVLITLLLSVPWLLLAVDSTYQQGTYLLQADSEYYRIGEPIDLEFIVRNTGSEPMVIYLHEEQFLNIDYRVRTMKNQPVLEREEFFLHKELVRRNGIAQGRLETKTIQPNQLFGITSRITDYYALQQPGRYVVEGIFYPHPHIRDNAIHTRPIFITIMENPEQAQLNESQISPDENYHESLETVESQVSYLLSLAQDQMNDSEHSLTRLDYLRMENNMNRLLQLVKEDHANRQIHFNPNQVLEIILQSRLVNNFDLMFQYISFEDLVELFPIYTTRYEQVSESRRRHIMERFKVYLQSEFLTEMQSYSLEKTLISGDTAWVIAMLEYQPGLYRKYSFQLRKIDDTWKLIYYHVDQSS